MNEPMIYEENTGLNTYVDPKPLTVFVLKGGEGKRVRERESRRERVRERESLRERVRERE